ncbi:hypothetical protein Syun_006638 [Stephania yunnanensis]|uniref:Uncharacterized protein n=1 Tax=Stephania yunnanensis TaxID=152371 RepID=A0AAP0PXR3_9MAGN
MNVLLNPKGYCKVRTPNSVVRLVFKEQAYGMSKRMEQAVGTSDTRGGRKPQRASYRKEKHRATKKEVALAGDLMGDDVQDEAS